VTSAGGFNFFQQMFGYPLKRDLTAFISPHIEVEDSLLKEVTKIIYRKGC